MGFYAMSGRLRGRMRVWTKRLLAWCGCRRAEDDCYSDIVDRLYSIAVSRESVMSRSSCSERLQSAASDIIRDPRYGLTESQRGELMAGFSVGFKGGVFSLVAAQGKGRLFGHDGVDVPEAVLWVIEMIGARLARAVLVQAGEILMTQSKSIQNIRTNWVQT